MSAESDHDVLLRNAVAGDGDALESLLLSQLDRLTADIARRLPDDVRGSLSAEDVVQEALIVAYQRISGFEPRSPGGFYAWLVQIAENRLMDAAKALRAAKRGGGWTPIRETQSADAELTPLIELLSGHSQTPSRAFAQDEAQASVRSALESLDPDYRDVLRMRYIEMLPIAACALRLQRSEGAVHMLLSRALQALRGRMGDTARFFTRKD
jgi:RNA polymerase sigma-70 factor (ECF subfamily)